MKATVAIVALSLFIASCDKEESQPDTDRYHPWLALYHLKLAYNFHDPDSLDELFAPEFEVVPTTIPEGFPDDWSKKDEIIAATGILNGTETIIFEMNTKDKIIGRPIPGDNSYRTPLLEIRLTIHITLEEVIYVGGTCQFELVRKDKDSRWQISKLYDYTITEMETVIDDETLTAMSWSEVKYRFYRANGEGNK